MVDPAPVIPVKTFAQGVVEGGGADFAEDHAQRGDGEAEEILPSGLRFSSVTVANISSAAQN